MKQYSPKPSHIWHVRLGNVFQRTMHKLVGKAMFDLSDINFVSICEFYLKEKMTKIPFQEKVECTHDLLDLIHADVCGLLSVSTNYRHS